MKRPFRLYNANTRTFLPWRFYRHLRNAHMGALVEVRWAKVGTTLEVIDVSSGNHTRGSYTRGVNQVYFSRAR